VPAGVAAVLCVLCDELPKTDFFHSRHLKHVSIMSDTKKTDVSKTGSQTYGETATVYMGVVSSKAPENIRPYIEKATPFIAIIADGVEKLIPLLVIYYSKVMEFYATLKPYHPELLAPSLMGLVMCFFGGSFMTLIAAFEAYRQSGWDATKKCIDDLLEDFEKVAKANAKDDEVDHDNDGIADVLQISPTELATRKSLLFLRTVDPVRFSGALTGLQTGFMVVIATLKVQFVKAIALGSSIAEVLDVPALRFAVPALEMILPAEYKRWAGPIVCYSVKSISVSIAWFLARVISAFHSALKGGIMAARNILDYVDTMGYYKINHEDTYMDEVAGYVLAALGLWFQLSFAFQLPFIMNILLFPFTIAEWFLMAMINRM
jgi:hypothetical protein